MSKKQMIYVAAGVAGVVALYYVAKHTGALAKLKEVATSGGAQLYPTYETLWGGWSDQPGGAPSSVVYGSTSSAKPTSTNNFDVGKLVDTAQDVAGLAEQVSGWFD